MREDPGLEVEKVSACLEARYGLRVASVAFLPVGYDPDAAVYEVVSRDGDHYFLKVRFGLVHEPGLLVPRALIDLGVRNVLAPLRTRASGLWCPLDGYPGYSVVLYPFVRGESAMVAGLSDDQWREFGPTLRAMHASGLGERLRGRLRVETFSLRSAVLVRRFLAMVDGTEFEGPAAGRLAAFWREHAGQIRRVLARVEGLGRSLRSRPFERVLCHADIHAAAVLVSEDGRIWLVDWDGPLVAPRERDLLFVVGSRIARAVQPREEALFFEGYGPIEIHPGALVYFRYERIIEDLGGASSWPRTSASGRGRRRPSWPWASSRPVAMSTAPRQSLAVGGRALLPELPRIPEQPARPIRSGGAACPGARRREHGARTERGPLKGVRVWEQCPLDGLRAPGGPGRVTLHS